MSSLLIKKLDKLSYHSNEGYSVTQVKKGYWIKENIKKESDKYINKSDFFKNNKCAYKAAFRLNILNELFENHTIKKARINFWLFFI